MTFALAAISVGLLGSCSKLNERLDNLDKRVDGIENNQIASIEQQIAGINTSINDLKSADAAVNSKIAELKKTAEAQQTLIDALKEADQAINVRIANLKSYVDAELVKVNDWAKATFATLAQYQQTADDLAALSVTVSGISTTLSEVQTSIAGLDTKIDGIDAALQGKIAEAKTELEGEISDLKTELEGKIAEAISTSETGLQSWVNEQLSAYYTAAQMDAKIAGLRSEINNLKSDEEAGKSKTAELETKLTQLTQDLAAAKTNIKAAYEAAIDEAINTNNGIINQTIQTKINEVNVTITNLTDRVTELEEKVGILTGRMDAAEEKINTIEQQIAAINQSISDLETIRTNIQELMEAKEAMGEDITDLKAKDQDLEGKITDLKNYVDTELANYATTEWANATFATLAKQEEIIADVAKLEQDLEGLDTKLDQAVADIKANLDQAIADLETSLKDWVNEQLTGYYTTAQIDEKIDGLQNQLDDLKTDTDANKSKIEELETKLDQLTQALDDAKTTIKTEYETAIATAIEEYNGTITQTIQTKIDAVNATITALTGRVETLESDVATLKNDVAALKAMIQSITILPAYNDGSVEAVDGILTVNFVVSPASSLENVTKDDIKLLVNTVKTKAATYTTVPAASATVNSATGDVSITADISGVTVGTGQALTVAVNVKNGLSDFTSGTVPVYVAEPVLPAGALKGAFTVSDDGAGNVKKVYFSQGNLYWDGDSFEFETNQYDFPSSWDQSHVGHFYWSKTASVAYAKDYSETGTSGDDVFFTNATETTANANFTVNGVTGKYRTLSIAEWRYLCNTRKVNGGNGPRYSVNINYGGKIGVVLYPDNYTGSELSGTVASLPEGVVFLPIAGRRSGSNFSKAGISGYCWSSSAYGTTCAYNVYFDNSVVNVWNYHDNRNTFCFSVRLVTDAE